MKFHHLFQIFHLFNFLYNLFFFLSLVVIKELWLSHPQLCVSVSHYENISHVESEKQCRWKCEQQTKCVMVQYDTKLKKCWLSDDRKITPKSGCNELFDYYIKGKYEGY